MTSYKNEFFFLVYGIQCLVHEMLLLLFRAYVFLMFAMRLGGAMVIAACMGGAFYALERMETNWLSYLSEWPFFVPLQNMRDSVLMADVLVGIYDPSFEYGYEIVTALIVVGVFLALRVFSKVAAPVVYAFPMPRRPLEPVLRWIPPEHKVNAVKAYTAAPKRKGHPWDGNWKRIIKRLPDSLQVILEPESAPVGLKVAAPSPEPQVPPAEPESVPQPQAAKVEPKARLKHKQAAPPLPPKAHT